MCLRRFEAFHFSSPVGMYPQWQERVVEEGAFGGGLGGKNLVDVVKEVDGGSEDLGVGGGAIGCGVAVAVDA